MLFRFCLMLNVLCALQALGLKSSDNSFFSSSRSWVYRDRFCFLSEVGRLKFSVGVKQKSSSLGSLSPDYPRLNVYCGLRQPWNSIYQTSALTCEMKVVASDASFLLRDSNEVAVQGLDLRCDPMSSSGSFACSGSMEVGALSHPTWCYVVISCCSCSHGVILDYTLRMTNGEVITQKEFSANQIGLFELSIAVSCCSVVLSMALYYILKDLKKKNLLRFVVSVYIHSFRFFLIAQYFLVILYAIYSHNGVVVSALFVLSQVCWFISDVLFLILLLLLANGYNVVKNRLKKHTFLIYGGCVCAYAVLYAVLLGTGYALFDPAADSFLYDSPMGSALVIIRIAAWTLFLFASLRTCLRYPSKERFYVRFGMAFSIWFWAVPVITWVSSGVRAGSSVGSTPLLESWNRERWVVIGNTLASFSAFCYMAYLWRSSKAESYFPFHSRSSKVGIAPGPSPNELDEEEDNIHRDGNQLMLTELVSPDPEDGLRPSNNNLLNPEASFSSSNAHLFFARNPSVKLGADEGEPVPRNTDPKNEVPRPSFFGQQHAHGSFFITRNEYPISPRQDYDSSPLAAHDPSHVPRPSNQRLGAAPRRMSTMLDDLTLPVVSVSRRVSSSSINSSSLVDDTASDVVSKDVSPSHPRKLLLQASDVHPFSVSDELFEDDDSVVDNPDYEEAPSLVESPDAGASSVVAPTKRRGRIKQVRPRLSKHYRRMFGNETLMNSFESSHILGSERLFDSGSVVSYQRRHSISSLSSQSSLEKPEQVIMSQEQITDKNKNILPPSPQTTRPPQGLLPPISSPPPLPRVVRKPEFVYPIAGIRFA